MKKTKHQSKSLNVDLISVLIILIMIAAPWFSLVFSNFVFIKTYIAGIGILVLVLITLWNKQTKDNTTIFNITPIKTALLSLFILGTLSIFWSSYVDFTITKWLLWLTALCAFIVGYHLKIDDKTLVRLSWGLLIAAFLIAGIGIMQYLFDFATLDQVAKPGSTFGNKNIATQPIVLIWPVTLFLLFSNKLSSKQTWIVTILTSLVMVFIFYTRTRASWLAILIEAVFIIGFLIIKRKELKNWISWNKEKTKAGLFGLLIFLLMINLSDQGLTPFWEVIESRIGGLDSTTGESAIESSAQARFSAWSVATNMIQSSPIFGTGLGSWIYNKVQLGFETLNIVGYERVHNDILELGVELGLTGLLLFLISVVALVIGSLKIINNDDKAPALFFLFIFIALSGSFVQMQLSFPYQLAMPMLLFGLYAGLIAKQSESFIKPLKTIKLNISKNYKNLTMIFWSIMLIITSSIYIDWMNTYNKLTTIIVNQKFERIKDAMPYIYHLDFPHVFGKISNQYYNYQNYNAVTAIEETALKYLSNTTNSLYRYGYSLLKKGRIKDALKIAQKLKKVQPVGLYYGQILELRIHEKAGRLDSFRKAFNEFINEDERLLSKFYESYNFLLHSSLFKKEFHKHSVNLYNKYKQYHGYNCEVENSIAIYYAQNKKYKKAKEHVNIVLNNNDSKCLNQRLVNTLARQGL